MEDQSGSKEQLLEEVKALRKRVSDLEAGQLEFFNISGFGPGKDSWASIQKNYEELVENTNSIILRWDRNGTITFLNRYGLIFFGYEPQEILGLNVVGSIVPETDHFGQDLDAMIRDIFVHPERYEKNQNENMRRNGERVWISWTNKPILDEQGEVTEILSIGNDHTELKRFEEELRRSKDELELRVAERTMELKESEEKYRLLFESIPIGIILMSSSGEVLEINRACLELLGSPGIEASRTINMLTFPPLVASGVSDLFRTCMTEKRFVHSELFYTSKWGKEICARLIIAPKLSAECKVEGCLAVMEDVMHRKLAVQALKQSEERYRSALQASPDPIVVYDREGRATYVNPAFIRTFGWQEQEVIGKKIDYVPEEERHRSFETLKLLLEGHVVPSFETKRLTKDGGLLDIYISAALITDDAGERVGSIVTLRDITQEKSLRAQLLQSQKMEAVGTLASGIAHDFNNLLQIVLGYSQWMLQKEILGELYFTNIQKIYDAGKRGADLVKELLTFSRKVEPVSRPVNLNQEILHVHRLLSSTIPKTIKIELDLSADLELVRADPSQFGQILMNLAVNSRDAMPDGGTLTFMTDNVFLDEQYCKDHLGMQPGRYVLLAVSDTGRGIDKNTQAHIFEPFFTTKEQGQGTGLGLATVYGIVKQHCGHILCFSEPEQGTTFRIYFPILKAEDVPTSPTLELDSLGGEETILLVEDEDVVRELSMELLNSFGYSVIPARNGKEALEIFQRKRQDVSLVVLDLIMPEMDGAKCLEHMLGMDPQAKIIVASGCSHNDFTSTKMLNGARRFVKKPYDIKELLHCIRKTLDEC